MSKHVVVLAKRNHIVVGGVMNEPIFLCQKICKKEIRMPWEGLEGAYESGVHLLDRIQDVRG